MKIYTTMSLHTITDATEEQFEKIWIKHIKPKLFREIKIEEVRYIQDRDIYTIYAISLQGNRLQWQYRPFRIHKFCSCFFSLVSDKTMYEVKDVQKDHSQLELHFWEYIEQRSISAIQKYNQGNQI